MGRSLAAIIVLAACAPSPSPRPLPPAPAPTSVPPPAPVEEPLPPLANEEWSYGPHAVVRKAPAGFTPSQLGNCRAISTRAVEATGDPKANASLAFDGDPNTVWNAGGFAPQSIRARLGGPQELDVSVSVVVVVPEMTPNGRALHMLEFDHEARFTLQVPLETNTPYVVAFGAPVRSRVLTIRSYSSASWIAFREIVPISCEGVPDLSALGEIRPPPPPDPGPQPHDELVSGVGSCHSAADCGPSDCCHARTCNAIGKAPRCDGTGCSQNVAPNTLDMGKCVCVKNQCGANIRMISRPPGR